MIDSGKMPCIIEIILLFTSFCTIALAGEACNDYVDRIIDGMRNDREVYLDPFEILNKSIEVSKQLLIFNFTGEASIYDGYIFGTSTLHRDTNVVVDHNKKTHLEVTLGAGQMLVKCSGKVKLMGHDPTAQVSARIGYVTMKLDIVPTGKDSNPEIQNFKFEDVKSSELKVSDLGPLNFFMNTYLRIINKFLTDIFRDALENRMKTFLDKKVKKYPIPENCLGDKYRRNLESLKISKN